MLVDLHAHYPMHLLPDEEQRSHEHARAWWRRRWQGAFVNLLSRLANYQGPGDTASVTEALMREGEVGVTLSVLYQPLDEMDLTQTYGAPPRESYFDDILAQRQTVEDHVGARAGSVAIAHSPRELDALLGDGVPILIHAVEGGFQLGRTAAEIRRNVRTLADLGVAYVTVAHLFFRDIATNAPALPFLPDWLYRWVFPQPKGQGLTALGREVVEAMVDEGILVDITHMRPQSITDVLALLDARDPGKDIPVIATHMAYRFGGLEYCFDDDTVTAVAARGGVLGCILCQHYITSGMRGAANGFEGSVAALCRHIDKIHALTNSYDHIAVGSDLDGYIKPALPGLEHMGRMAALQRALRARYGDADAEKICSGNALRVLRAAWGEKRPRPAGA
ncbi:MAG TPA: membrane dipeptidase [Solirubrobacteraceae bacterium]|jgi:microsomal dipeptidase-like Zn-dependent dipeptidase|nr:membrane dipeptidase [Solirubrobacteraceae bacterium]